MTGATQFTRKAGLAGLLVVPLGLLGFALQLRATRTFPYDSRGHYWMLAATVIAMLVFTVGLVARHWHHWWALPAVLLAVVSGALAVAGGRTYGPAGVGLPLTGVSLAYGGILIGALVADELPRPPLVLILLAARLDRPAERDVIAMVLSFVGYVWLAWAMWREPLPHATPRERIDPWPPLAAWGD